MKQRKTPPASSGRGFRKTFGLPRSVSALDEEGALADAVAEVVKFCAADFAFVCHFDLGDTRGVNREYTLNTFSVGNLADGESRVDAAAAFGDDETCEDLDALFATLDNTAMDFDGVAYVRDDDVFLELLLFDFFDDGHGDNVAEKCWWCAAEALPDARGEMASGLVPFLQGKIRRSDEILEMRREFDQVLLLVNRIRIKRKVALGEFQGRGCARGDLAVEA